MVAGHQESVALFERETGTEATTTTREPDHGATRSAGTDSQVKDAARDLLPTIKQHLTQAEDIQKSLAKPATK